jgi:TPR repeat protein
MVKQKIGVGHVSKSIRFIAIVLALIAADAVSGAPRHGGSAYAASRHSTAARVMWLAERGNARAQAKLGYMYSIGRGVPQNYIEAAEWYRLAAEQGNGSAQFALGLLYSNGRGVRLDLVQAHMWLNLSAAQSVGHIRDFKERIRNSIASKMTFGQVEDAQRLALAWHESH